MNAPKMVSKATPRKGTSPPTKSGLEHDSESRTSNHRGVAMATTHHPTNTSELQLYRVLQRANLLQYYETFITQGGDDVQQLCEAGEEEFLEIMALVGMASKPLHVRRLQKSLQEWVANPGIDLSMFQQPMSALTPPPPPPGSIVATMQASVAGAVAYAVQAASSNVISAPTWNPRGSSRMNLGTPSPPPVTSGSATAMRTTSSSAPPVIEFMPSPTHSGCGGMDTPKHSPSPSNRDSSSPSPMPILTDSQIRAISQSAEKLAKSLPLLDPKPMNTKKQICKEIEDLMSMEPEHPERMDLLRKYAAIYGRFDSKRKNEKQLSLHEISVNEAAAQLCAHNTALLTRREELFPLARTVVRDSGYQYAKGHSRAQNEMLSGEPSSKRSKISLLGKKCFKSELDQIQQEERLAEVNTNITQITSKLAEARTCLAEAKDAEDNEKVASMQTELDTLTAQHRLLMSEQNDINEQLANRYQSAKKAGQGTISGDDETDSSNLPSGCSSPRNGTGDNDDLDYYKAKVKVEAKGHIQQTLFDEGLRIAQQYGMADFAEELKGLKHGSDDSDTASEHPAHDTHDDHDTHDIHDTHDTHDASNNNGPEGKPRRMWEMESSTTNNGGERCPSKAFNLSKTDSSSSHVAIETS